MSFIYLGSCVRDISDWISVFKKMCHDEWEDSERFPDIISWMQMGKDNNSGKA